MVADQERVSREAVTVMSCSLDGFTPVPDMLRVSGSAPVVRATMFAAPVRPEPVGSVPVVAGTLGIVAAPVKPTASGSAPVVVVVVCAEPARDPVRGRLPVTT
jgi:hypothetical protein